MQSTAIHLQEPTFEGFRLSPQQRRLWLLQQADSRPYQAQAVIRIVGQLNHQTLETALQTVVQQQEILRTHFRCLPGMTIPLQVVSPEADAVLERVESEKEKAESTWLSALQASSQASVSDQDVAILRSQLVALQPGQSILRLSLPALCADAVTLQNLVHEISQAYAAICAGDQYESEPVQYADLAEWQNELLESEETAIAQDYWRQQDLSDFSQTILPLTRRAPEGSGFALQSVTLPLSSSQIKSLQAIADQFNTSLDQVLLTCWQILLWKLTQSPKLVVGTAFNGRKYEELEAALGLFARYLPLQSQLEATATFGAILQQLATAIASATEWQEYFTWEQLGADNQLIDTSTSTERFFPFCFEFLQISEPDQADGVSFAIESLSACVERFYVKLTCIQRGESLVAQFDYDAHRSDEATIARLTEYFATLLESLAESSETAITHLEILSQRDRQQLLVDFNQTQVAFSDPSCFHQRFEQQVLQTPNAVAVVFEDQQLTYADLNHRANQLAHFLKQRGVEREVLVALCVERSLENIIGLLGILKAGGVYVPLDPSLPTERLLWMLQDTQAPVVLTQNSLKIKLVEPSATLPSESLDDQKRLLVCLDGDWAQIAQEETQNPASVVEPENLAYVIYTSGSTGKPKGVCVEHRQLSNYLDGISTRLQLPAGASYAIASTFAADLGHTVVFTALSTGGCLHILSQDRATNARALTDYCQRHPIDCLKIVPSHLQALLAIAEHGGFLPRQRLILGGEACPWSLVQTLKAIAPHCQILNHYGPTETTVGVLTYDIESLPETAHLPTVPLGRPLPNTQIYILDASLRPVPIGVPGELYISGFGLARGYLNQPELTAERFIGNPFKQPETSGLQESCSPQAELLYKTGDLARYLPDGTVEFLGRTDDQVKIRGFRIELGEIESLLRQQPTVQQAVVIVREDEPGDRRLVAYVVSQQNAELTVQELRRSLQAELPEYMLPSAFVLLKTLPLTANGKLDRQALPKPEAVTPDLLEVCVAPRNPVEEVLAGIWAQVLRVERVGITDNFFALGGHSLLATQVISRISSAFGVELPLRSLFESPTLADLADKIEQALRSDAIASAPPLTEIQRSTPLPLSFAQQRLWFLDQLEPGSASYNIPAVFRLTGSLNPSALEQSIHAVVHRHEALRTTFITVEGQPTQRIHSTWEWQLPVLDCSAYSNQDLQTLLLAEAQKSFDLAQGPLFRFTLLRLSDREHIFLLTLHHIIADGWSMGVLIEELVTLYNQYTTEKETALQELPIQYADFAVWQRQWLQGETLEAQLNYWRQQLSGTLPVLELPTDAPRPTVQTFRGARYPFLLSSELTNALKKLSQEANVTLFMALLAAFKTWLYRYTSQTDLLVGSPIANRNRAEIEGLIGFFVNTLVLRSDLSGNPSFQELLQRVREVTLGAYAHQDLPFEKLVEALQPERSLNSSPFFQVMFILQNAPLADIELPELHVSQLEVDNQTAKFDLTLCLVEAEEGLLASLEYNTDLFTDSTIARMVGHFQTLLEGIIHNSDQPISTLPFLTLAEQQQVLVEWNQTQTPYPLDQCLHQLFEAQAAKTPEAIAVIYEGQSLTYQELNQQAEQLAQQLQSLGVGPDVPVGICVDRSLEMVIGLLGILKAGAAYLPLDPNYPRDRLHWMLADSQAPLLLTQAHLLPRLPLSGRDLLENGSTEIVNTTHPDLQLLCLNSRRPVPAAQPQTTSPDHLAYIIYTSGSTGKPKGVQIPHRAVVNFLSAMQQQPGMSPQDKLLSVTTLSFDIAALELFLPLTIGASVEVVSRAVAVDGSQLMERLQESQATVMQATPATWRMLIAAGWSGNAQLKILCGGEALSPDLAQQLCDRAGAVWNMYGPTETTIWSTVHRVQPGETVIPIGRPIANTQVYVLDAALQPVPIGVAGELYIGGAGVARGYLNRPELSAARFISTAQLLGQASSIQHQNGGITRDSSAVLYKTGDLVRYRPDGVLECLGRMDHQVKLRGHRIELGEIEAVLETHPQVQQAVAVVREDQPSVQRLVAYVIASEQPPTVSELRQCLQKQLPVYMVPAAFVLLESLPLTPNGKVDRRSLPAPEALSLESDNLTAMSKTPIQEMLASLWGEVLGVSVVSLHDNFFEVGGHSLLATQLISRVREVFRVDISLRSLFESPTIAEFAQCLEAVIQQAQGLEAPKIQPVERSESLPLAFAQQRLWFLDQLEPGNPAYNIPLVVRLSGALNVAALEQSLNAVVERHESLRTTLPSLQGRPFQAIAPHLTLTLPLTDLQHLPENEREEMAKQLAIAEIRTSFDLAQGPLLRAKLFQLAATDYILVLTLHHVISDGWSMGVLIQELTSLYLATTQGKPANLPSLPIQYVDFAVWQRQWLQGEVLAQQLNYWKQQLGQQLGTTMLPPDYPRPSAPTHLAGIHKFEIPSDLSRSLQTLSRTEGSTLFMTLLAALKVLLYRYAERQEIVVGTDVANRNRLETEALIGFFVNLLVLRTDLSGNPSFRSLLQLVREVTLEAYLHQDLPFDKLVEELRPDRQAQNSLFQVLFVLQNTPRQAVTLPDLTLTQLDIDGGIAKFEIALFMEETDQGLAGIWKYNADLFAPQTIARLSQELTILLKQVAADPEISLQALTQQIAPKPVVQASKPHQQTHPKMFKLVKPKVVNLQEELIKTSFLEAEETMPLVLQPVVDDLDVADWAKNHRSWIEEKLLKHGALLFRGFGLKTANSFEQVAQAIAPELFGEYGDLPREGVGGKVYTSTPYPADKAILFHNESSHMHRWPLKIWFFCVQPSQEGGETPIVDCRRIYQLLNPQLRDRIQAKKLMYVRNYTDGLDVSWQHFFNTSDRTAVEAYCRNAGIEWEWKPDNGLRTREIRQAVAKHPRTGEMVFFNQLQLHHIACLDPTVRDSLLRLFKEENLPRHVYYGDGTPIEDSVIEEICEVYRQATVSFPWQQGDLLMLDNMLTAHGRNPYVGPRKIVVAMAEMVTNQEI